LHKAHQVFVFFLFFL